MSPRCFRFTIVWLFAGLAVASRLLMADTATPAPAAKTKGTPAPVARAETHKPTSELVAPIVIKLPEKPAYPRAVNSWLEAQIALARAGFSCGSIDGVQGAQTVAALQAYQDREGIPSSGALDDATREQLQLASPALAESSITDKDLAQLQPVSPTWLGKSGQTALAYETALEMMAERAHASPALIRRLNPAIDWTQPVAGMAVTVPAIARHAPTAKAAKVHIQLAAHILEARDADDVVIAHFPVSIATKVEKRPVGELHVTVVIPDPDYTFNPEVFPESEEARTLGRNLLLPPGPNNPVGVAWVGLDLPGYGIHGTPQPEMIGRTESHGCFRLANWDARALLDLAWVGLPVVVDP